MSIQNIIDTLSAEAAEAARSQQMEFRELSTGAIIASRGILNDVGIARIQEALKQYRRRDWGISTVRRKLLNEESADAGRGEIKAYYPIDPVNPFNGQCIIIRTLGDRSVTEIYKRLIDAPFVDRYKHIVRVIATINPPPVKKRRTKKDGE